MRPVSVLVIGQLSALLKLLPGGVEVHTGSTIAEAIDKLEAGVNPALVVIDEQWPGERSQREIELLQRLLPLARVWRIAGPWCEGELRTYPPTPGTLRSYGHQTESRLGVELQRLVAGQQARSTLPATMIEEEALLALHRPARSRTPRFAFVFARERESGLALLDACQTLRHVGIWAKGLQGLKSLSVDVALCDLRPHGLGDEGFVQELRQVMGDAPLLAVVGFPRPDDIATAQRIGYAGVISKPLELADLAWHLDRLAPQLSSAAANGN